MNYNIAPKQAFLSDPKNIEAHRALVQSETLRRGIDTALAQMQRMLADSAPPEMGACAAAHLRCLGAHDFVQTFYQLAEQTEIAPKTSTTNLPGNVSQMPRKN